MCIAWIFAVSCLNSFRVCLFSLDSSATKLSLFELGLSCARGSFSSTNSISLAHDRAGISSSGRGITSRSLARVMATYISRMCSRSSSFFSSANASSYPSGFSFKTMQYSVLFRRSTIVVSDLIEVAVLTGMTTGHSRPLAEWMEYSETASSSESGRPSTSFSPSSHIPVISLEKDWIPRTEKPIENSRYWSTLAMGRLTSPLLCRCLRMGRMRNSSIARESNWCGVNRFRREYKSLSFLMMSLA